MKRKTRVVKRHANPARAVTVERAKALGREFGARATAVELREEQSRPAGERRSRADLLAAIEELAFWEMGEAGVPESYDLQVGPKHKSLQRAFYAAVRGAAKERLATRAKGRRHANPALTPERAEALGRTYGAKAWRQTISGYSVKELRADVPSFIGTTPAKVDAHIMDNAAELAMVLMGDTTGHIEAMERAPNSAALWRAFRSGVDAVVGEKLAPKTKAARR